MVKNVNWLDDLQQLPEVQNLLQRLLNGAALSFENLVDPSKAVFIALLHRATRKPVIVVCGSIKHYESLNSEIQAFVPHASNFPEVCWDRNNPDKLPDFETLAQTLRTLHSLQENKPDTLLPVIITTQSGFEQKLPPPNRLKLSAKQVSTGMTLDLDSFMKELVEMGFERENSVFSRGQFAKRGGILDLFPFQSQAPVRLEWFGDTIESIRVFDIDTQSSTKAIETVEIAGISSPDESAGAGHVTLKSYLPSDYIIWTEGSDDKGVIRVQVSNHGESEEAADIHTFHHDFLSTGTADTVLQEHRYDLLIRHWQDWIDHGFKVVVCTNNEGEEKRLREFTQNENLTGQSTWIQAPLLRGFSWPEAKFVLLTDAEIFGRYQTLRMLRSEQKMARARARREALDFSEFKEGDYVVHVHHGIARFLGIQQVDIADGKQEVLTLEYDKGALLHVPVEQAFLVGRYVGVGKFRPALDQLGGLRWAKAAAQAKRAVADYAAQLLKVQAQREIQHGFAFQKDTDWQREFEDAFLYDETPDQLKAIEDTKEDMESSEPMDRLICGDVGFGKTEVAIRAAFKAVMSGKQVAILAPTTVLAQQHERTFKERMADYPVRIELISRFRTKGQVLKSLKAAKEGRVDILIGTHRLLQPDVQFKDLGLVVVDEEQRFGVKHKEKFKEVFKLIDILTLSATPIPRTLYLSLVGAKDISTIETPPPNRLPVETTIAAFDERLVRNAIERELARGGQVYYLHNRVESIQKVRDRLSQLIPKARIEYGHGQMHEHELEGIMMRFVAGEIDVLVATTIIESGLDIPRANTIIIDRADRFGLADLYQLRGRVGRGQTKAYAYLLLPRHLMIEADARKRVSAIRQYSQLGAGFKVAMRDLEIRGAGNILGTEQSGHATAIGFELYCQLLKETLAQMKGEKVPKRIEVKVRLDFLPLSENQSKDQLGAFIPKAYMEQSQQRIEAYRKLAEAFDLKELDALFEQWKDRFGKPPLPALLLYEVSKIRLLASSVEVTSVEVEDGKLMVKKAATYVLVGNKFPRLSATEPKARLGEIQKFLKSLILPQKEPRPPRSRRVTM